MRSASSGYKDELDDESFWWDKDGPIISRPHFSRWDAVGIVFLIFGRTTDVYIGLV